MNDQTLARWVALNSAKKKALVPGALVGIVSGLGLQSGQAYLLGVKERRPNNSFKPTPLRGVVLGSRY